MLSVSLYCAAVHAQDIDLSGVDFSSDIAFDDSIFNDAFNEEESANSWLEPFTFKLSQQAFGQINKHSVEIAPGFSFLNDRELENNRLGLNIRYQNAFAPGWLLQGSGHVKVFLNNDYEYEANGNNIETEFRVNELFIQRSFDNSSVKFGRQTVAWGETIGNSVLDVINFSEFRDFTIIDIEDGRKNQWMLVHDYYGEESNLSTFINLYPEYNPAPHRGSPFFFEPPFNLIDYDRDDEPLFEIGTRWSKSFEGSDISVMAAYLYENQLRYRNPTAGFGDAIAENNDFFLLGFSANRAIGKLLLAFDFAFSHDVLADSAIALAGLGNLNATPLKKDRIGTSFGFEYGISNTQQMSLGVQAQKMLDEEEGLLPGQVLQNEGVVGSVVMRYSNTFFNDDAVFSMSAQTDLEGDSFIAFLDLSYTLNDYWGVSTQLMSLSASDNTPLILFDEDVRLGVTLTYTF